MKPVIRNNKVMKRTKIFSDVNLFEHFLRNTDN